MAVAQGGGGETGLRHCRGGGEATDAGLGLLPALSVVAACRVDMG